MLENNDAKHIEFNIKLILTLSEAKELFDITISISETLISLLSYGGSNSLSQKAFPRK